MILPSIGFAYLSAAWMTRPRADGALRLRMFPFFWFVVLQAATVPTTAWLMQFMETEAQRHLRLMVEAFGRAPRAGDRVFFVNTTRNFEALFAQDRLQHVLGGGPTRVSVLCDVGRPVVSRLDERTLRLEAESPAFFSSYLGLMGTPRDRPWRAGDVIRVPDFEARIARVEGGAVTALEIRFAQPLSSDSYRFFWSEEEAPPWLWTPPAADGMAEDQARWICIGSRGSSVGARRAANSLGEGESLTARAGMPTTVVMGSTSWTTTAPAPTTASKPIRTFWMTVAPIPMNAPDSTVTWPASRTPGQTWAAVPIIDS
jgi:hypothetical protein